MASNKKMVTEYTGINLWSNIYGLPPNIAINHRTFGAGLKIATRFLAGYGRRYV